MIQDYIVSALRYSLVYCVIHILIRFFYLRKIKKTDFCIKTEIKYIMFGAYITALLSQTVFPIWHIFYINGRWVLEISTFESRSFNYIPFKTIFGYWNGDLHYYSGFETGIVNLLGNIFLFIPFGLLFPIVFDKYNRFRETILFGILLSVFIEFMQIFVERSTDIDDVIVNSLGVFIGFVWFKIFDKLFIR